MTAGSAKEAEVRSCASKLCGDRCFHDYRKLTAVLPRSCGVPSRPPNLRPAPQCVWHPAFPAGCPRAILRSEATGRATADGTGGAASLFSASDDRALPDPVAPQSDGRRRTRPPPPDARLLPVPVPIRHLYPALLYPAPCARKRWACASPSHAGTCSPRLRRPVSPCSSLPCGRFSALFSETPVLRTPSW
jgi:hypothetical protein